MPLDLRSVVLNGARISYFDSGNAGDDVLVLVHAFPVGVQMWEPQRNAFPRWRLIAPALPGFDGSDTLPVASLDGCATQVLALLDHLGIGRAVFGGLSLGGYVVFGVWRQASSRVAALVLADTRASADSDEARAGRLRMQETVRQDGVAAVAREVVPKLLGATTQTRRPEVVATVKEMIVRQRSEAVIDAAQAMMDRPNSEPMLREIAVPTLILVGEEDVLTPPSEAERMREAITGSTLARIPEAGHLSNLENADAFDEATRGFLNAL